MGGILFDSHCHVNHEDLDRDARAALIREIESSDVGEVCNVGFDMPSSELAAALAARHPWLHAAVGVHPHDVDKLTPGAILRLGILLGEPNVVALGEIGLDFYRSPTPYDIQRDAFRRQIRLALEKRVPILIHDRDSEGEAVRILEEEGAFSDERTRQFEPNPEDGRADARVVLHCFSGTADDALRAIELGATISIAGQVTWKKDEKLREVASVVPLCHLMVETDSPYLTPTPYRGRPNKSPYVEYTARAIAEIKGMPYEELAAATYANAKRFFDV
jgi:TatD DNase family protein